MPCDRCVGIEVQTTPITSLFVDGRSGRTARPRWGLPGSFFTRCGMDSSRDCRSPRARSRAITAWRGDAFAAIAIAQADRTFALVDSHDEARDLAELAVAIVSTAGARPVAGMFRSLLRRFRRPIDRCRRAARPIQVVAPLFRMLGAESGRLRRRSHTLRR